MLVMVACGDAGKQQQLGGVDGLGWMERVVNASPSLQANITLEDLIEVSNDCEWLTHH